MGLRLYAIYTPYDHSRTYTLEIFDEEYTGVSREVCLTGDVVKRFEGKDKDPFQLIMPTTLDFTLIIERQEHVDFVRAMILAQERRFWVRLRRGVDVDFIGLITPDETYLDGRGVTAKQLYNISAFDGISYLKNIPYRHAQEQQYLDQQQDGKFRAIPLQPSSIREEEYTGLKMFNGEDHDYGGHYDTVTRGFQRAGRYDFKVYLSIISDVSEYMSQSGSKANFFANHGTLGFVVRIRLYKIDVNSDEVLLSDLQEVYFSHYQEDDIAAVVSNVRREVTITADDVELQVGESVHVDMSWDISADGGGPFTAASDYTRYRFEVGSYFENTVDSSINIINHYDSVKEHIYQIFQHLPTRAYYGTNDFVGMLLTHREDNQGSALMQDYMHITYNGFVTDYSSTPPRVVSCYEALERILLLLPGQLSYRSGMYWMMPWHNVTDVDVYDIQFNYIGRRTEVFSEDPMECIRQSTYTFLPPIREMLICYDALSTKNLLDEAASFFPNFSPTAKFVSRPISMEDRVYRLRVVIRVGTLATTNTAALQALISSGKSYRHEWRACLKVNGKYAKIDNINPFLAADAIYSTPIYSTVSTSRITIQGPLQSVYQEHVADVSFDLPAEAYEGSIEFGIEYLHTVVRENPTTYSTVFLPELEMSVDRIRLSTLDAVDDYELYTDTICTRAGRDANSVSHQYDLTWSDQWRIDSDPGAIKVHNGTDLVKPATWGGETITLPIGLTATLPMGRTLQERIAQWMANRVTLPAEVYNGEFVVTNYRLGHATHHGVDGVQTQYLLLRGQYSTYKQQLSGQWIKYEIGPRYNFLNLSTYVVNRNAQSQKVSDVQQGRGSTSGTIVDSNSPAPIQDTITIVQYQHYTNTENTDTIAIPSAKPLPDPALYSTEEMMRIFDGSKKGSGNMIYRSIPSHPDHFSVDFLTNSITLWRAAKSGREFFFMWTIVNP